MHQSAGPVAVPGGTSVFTIDETAPTSSTPVTEAVSVSKGFTQSFPFPRADVRCAGHAGARLRRDRPRVGEPLDGRLCRGDRRDGRRCGRCPLGAHPGKRIRNGSRGENGGTSGFAPMAIPVSQGCDGPLTDATIDAGESIAVRVSVTNWCNANRTVALAYDATSAPLSITFAPIVPPIRPSRGAVSPGARRTRRGRRPSSGT